MGQLKSKRQSSRGTCSFRRNVYFTVIFLLSLTACEKWSERRKLQDYVHNSYYTSLASARGDVIKEWIAFANATKESPADNAKLKMLPLIEKWSKVTTNFSNVTEPDALNPELKLMRDKYIEADDLFTYAITEYWMALTPGLSEKIRSQHLVDSSSAYKSAMNSLATAHAMTEELLNSR